MKNTLKLKIIAVAFLSLLAACGAELKEISVTLTPSALLLTVFQSAQFNVRVNNSSNNAVTWSLSGSGCSGASCGTISNTGLYTAPSSVPSPATVTVRATSAADTSKSANATITIIAEPSTWTWVSGGMFRNEPGTYGTKGVAAPQNAPGGRGSAVSWLDSSGKLWLFGGSGYDADSFTTLNDLWKYDSTSNQWTWVSGSNRFGGQYGIYGTKGISDAANVPGGRQQAVSWSDSSGKLWLFGGLGVDGEGHWGYLNDLWRFDTASNEWTWISGSNIFWQAGTYGTKGLASPENVPGSRDGAISWIDSRGKLLLFGGYGVDSTGESGGLNDLWKFDPMTLEWTWVSGSDIRGQKPVYGTKGLASPENDPGVRGLVASWIDSSDNLWLFGGGEMNDLWKFDSSTLEWTWASGSNIPGQFGNYGVKGQAAPENIPGSRGSLVSWIDSGGNLWLFGGIGRYPPAGFGVLNDLWKFNPATLEWTWMSGSSTGGEPGSYGTIGEPHFMNVPGARKEAVSWTSPQGEFWLFGGEGYDSIGQSGKLDDLWRYIR